MKEPNDSPARPRPARLASGHPPVLRACRTLLIEHMAAGVEQVFIQADDTLFDAAQCAENNQVQALFLDALREVRALRASLVRETISRMARCYDLYFAPQTHEPVPSSSTEPLTLIDQDVFETRLQAEHAVARAHSDNLAMLALLEERFAEIEGAQQKRGESPISPKQLSDSFYGTLESSPLHLKVRAILFTLFDEHALRTVDGLYARLGRCLDDAGVPRPARPKPKRANDHDPSAPDRLPTTAANALERLNALLALLHGATAQPTVSNDTLQASQSHVHYLPLAQLDGLLAELQSNLTDTQSRNEFQDLRQTLDLLLQRETSGPVRPTPRDAQIIDLTGLLFSHMETDPLVSEAARPLLLRLHVPFLRSALRTPDVLTDSAHPHRLLFDRLCQAAELWSTADTDTLPLSEAINEAETLLSENHASSSRVEAVTRRLDDLIQELTRRSQLRERRAVEAARGQDRLEAARSRATAVVARLCDAGGIPTAVERFMRGTWQDVLIFAHLRHGETSTTWQYLLGVTDALGRTFAVDTPADMHWQDILSGITSGLNMLGHFSEQNIERICSDLTTASEVVRRKAPGYTRQRSLASKAPLNLPEPACERQPPGIPDQHAPLAGLSPGQWFEFGKADARRQLKLAWFSRDTGNYMFVGPDGQTAFVLSREALASKLAANEVRHVDEAKPASLLDRAIQQLQRLLKRQPR